VEAGTHRPRTYWRCSALGEVRLASYSPTAPRETEAARPGRLASGQGWWAA
jgi:hypothetical protein